MASHTGNSSLVLVESTCQPPIHLRIHPSIHHPSIHPSVHPDCLVPLSGWAHPLSTWFTCHGSLYPIPTPRHTPQCWPRVQRVVRAGPPHMQYCNPHPSWSHSITEHVSSPHLFVFRCDRSIKYFIFCPGYLGMLFDCWCALWVFFL